MAQQDRRCRCGDSCGCAPLAELRRRRHNQGKQCVAERETPAASNDSFKLTLALDLSYWVSAIGATWQHTRRRLGVFRVGHFEPLKGVLACPLTKRLPVHGTAIPRWDDFAKTTCIVPDVWRRDISRHAGAIPIGLSHRLVRVV